MQEQFISKVKPDDRHKERIRRSVRSLLDSFKVILSAEGVVQSLNGNSILHYEMEASKAILAEYIVIEGIESASTKRSLIETTAVKMKEKKTVEYDDFLIILEEEVKRIYSYPDKRFAVLFPLKVNNKSLSVSSIDVLGTNFVVQSWNTISTIFDSEKFRQSFEYKSNYYNPLVTPIVCYVDAPTEIDARVKAYRSFHILRTVLNFVQNYGYYKTILFGQAEPIGKLPNVNYCTCVDLETNIISTVFSHEQDPHTIAELTTVDLEQTQEILQKLHIPQSDNDVMRNIIEALHTYGNAMDADFREVAFLSFWQVLEFLSFRDRNDKMDNLLKRIRFLLGNDVMKCDLLELCHNIRNRYAHRGEYPDDTLETISLLKMIVDHCLIVMLGRVYPQCSDWNDLEVFYSFASKTNRIIETEQTLLPLIKSFKV